MPDGEREAAPQALWLRATHGSVSKRTMWIVQGLLLLAALGLLSCLVLVPRVDREHAVLEAGFDVLRSDPTTNAILSQLPPERLESVRARIAAIVGRWLTPALLGAALLCAFAAAALGVIAHKLRAALATLRIARAKTERRPLQLRAAFWVIGALAAAAHLPFTLQSIRFDEDSASLHASSGWLAWANNLDGWHNHVAGLLAIRLSTAVFGMNELSVRAPAILISSLALAYLSTYLWSRFSAWVGILTAAITMTLPLWAEQTGLARGYCLTFTGAALLVVAALRLHREQSQLQTETVLCLFAGIFLGSLAHVLFGFTALGVFALACFSAQIALKLRAVLLWWVALAGVVPATSAALGLPASCHLVVHTGHTPYDVVLQRNLHELAFRHHGLLGVVVLTLCAAAGCGTVLALPARARTPLAVMLGCAILAPVAANPEYMFPRFYVHTVAFVVPCIAWFLSTRVLRANHWANAGVLVAIAGLWISTRPWAIPTYLDIRTAASIARAERQAHGDAFAVDTFVTAGMRFYNGDPGRVANSQHPLPSDIERFMMFVPHKAPPPSLGFRVERRLDGTEGDLLLLQKNTLALRR
jgi:hypothetical protein